MSCKSSVIFSACSLNLLSWISAYRCWRVPALRYHLHTCIATGRGLIFCRYWCRNTRKTENMPWFWEVSGEGEKLHLPGFLNSVYVKEIKCSYFLDILQWHLQEFPGIVTVWLWMATEGYQIIFTTSPVFLNQLFHKDLNYWCKNVKSWSDYLTLLRIYFQIVNNFILASVL